MPVDNLDGGTVGVSYFGDMDLINPVIVSPDAGGVYRYVTAVGRVAVSTMSAASCG